MDAIVVRGIHAEGMHGLDAERKTPQPFVVDVVVPGDLAKAATQDCIEETIDYAAIVQQVRDVVMNESYELIESLAEAIAKRVKGLGAAKVNVRVSKPRAARSLSVDEVAVEIER